MLEIRITDYKGYTYASILEYLYIQHTVYFKIILPKQFIAPNDQRLHVFWDYYVALYAGEKLGTLSEHFAYYIPCPYTKSDFFFEIACADMEELARVLAYILWGYQQQEDTDFLFFHHEASDFLVAVGANEIKPRCEGFMPLIEEYMGEGEW